MQTKKTPKVPVELLRPLWGWIPPATIMVTPNNAERLVAAGAARWPDQGDAPRRASKKVGKKSA